MRVQFNKTNKVHCEFTHCFWFAARVRVRSKLEFEFDFLLLLLFLSIVSNNFPFSFTHWLPNF